ncbi:hypothetical protein ACOMHN_035472 [Nucella lapillus]
MEGNVTTSLQNFPLEPHDTSLAPSNTTTNFVDHGSKDPNGADPTVIAVDFWLAGVTICTLASLGILGNVFSIVVWHTDRTFKAVLFLFKYLAVWDTLYLALVMVYSHIIRHRGTAANLALTLSLYHGASFFQLVSVHVTLLIAVSRWVAVTFPLCGMRHLASKRIYIFSGLILLYCAILQASQGLFNAYYPHSTLLFIIKRVLGLGLPFLLLFIFNFCLVWTASRHFKTSREVDTIATKQAKHPSRGKCSFLSSNSTQVSLETEVTETSVLSLGKESGVVLNTGEGTSQNPPEQQKQVKQEQQQQQQQQQKHQQHQKQKQQHQQQQQEKSKVNAQVPHPQCTQKEQPRKLTMIKVVVLLSFCSLIAYPVGSSLQVYAIERQDLPLMTRVIIMHVAHIWQVINSGINVLIYWFFVSKFRYLARNLRCHLASRLAGARAPEFPNR